MYPLYVNYSQDLKFQDMAWHISKIQTSHFKLFLWNVVIENISYQSFILLQHFYKAGLITHS